MEAVTLLALVVSTANAVAASSSRNDKVAALAELLAAIHPHETPIVVGLLTGEIRQGRIGVGWAAVRDLDVENSDVGSPDSPSASLTVTELDEAMTKVASISGSGSKARRAEVLETLLARATEDEVEFITLVLTGGLRQGALDGVMTTAIAKAAGVPVAAVRRAAMFSGDLGETAEIARSGGRSGLDAVGLRVGRGIQPMLASTSTSATEALDELGASKDDSVAVSVQAKLDGIRLQVHRDGDRVWLYTRNLNDVTDRLPLVCDLARSFPSDQFVLDGELIGMMDADSVDSESSPEMFQDTASTFASGSNTSSEEHVGRVDLQTQFFDILHLDGEDLVDLPLVERLERLERLTGSHMIGGIVTSDHVEAETFLADVLAAGHEGVMVKALDSVYAAGRRGKTWRKVKPVYTYDLVVLGAEWGHGRRTGWLSNLHLGARRSSTDDDDSEDEFVMVGKTFKGLTDELLTWQTEELLARETHREGITVFTRPELVVEIAIDGVQRSTTYPGGLALRFARVKQYRPDKTSDEADSISDLAARIS